MPFFMAEWQRQVEIRKLDEAENLVFGYLSVAQNADGSLVEDLQGDVIEPAELEKAAYAFMADSRAADEMHQLDRVGDVVESIVLTEEKQAALGIPRGTLPVGWWVGVRVAPETFAQVKSGNYRAFSIGGMGQRVHKHGDHDQSTHGSWATGNGAGGVGVPSAPSTGGGSAAGSVEGEISRQQIADRGSGWSAQKYSELVGAAERAGLTHPVITADRVQHYNSANVRTVGGERIVSTGIQAKATASNGTTVVGRLAATLPGATNYLKQTLAGRANALSSPSRSPRW